MKKVLKLQRNLTTLRSPVASSHLFTHKCICGYIQVSHNQDVQHNVLQTVVLPLTGNLEPQTCIQSAKSRCHP